MSALRRAIDILHVVAGHEGITAREMASVLRLSKSATHRWLSTLGEVGLLQRAAGGEGFVLGPLINELGGGQMSRQRLIQVARPHMAALRDRCGETVGVHVLQADRRVLLDQAESHQEHRWVYKNPGIAMPLHAGAASKMLLAMLPAARGVGILKRNGLVVFTPSTPRDADDLGRELRRVRAQGYALSQQEVTPGISSIAAPIDGPGESLPAVMSITGPQVRLPAAVLKRLLPRLRETAAHVARDLEAAGRRSEVERPRRLGRGPR